MRMTFREIAIWADGVNERDAQEWKDKITLAWLNASLSRIPLRQKKTDREPFPTLESLLPKPPKLPTTRKQFADQLKQRLAALQRRNNKRYKQKKPKVNG